ncbi:MAG: hypothetical protein RL757_548 [Bacteroidota bacterium]|jgi:subtilisin family serine protease
MKPNRKIYSFVLLFIFACTTFAVAQNRPPRKPIVRDSAIFLAQFNNSTFTQAQVDSVRQLYGATLLTDYSERVQGYFTQKWKFGYPTFARRGARVDTLKTVIQIATDGKNMSGASGLTPTYEVADDNEPQSQISATCADNGAINDGTCAAQGYTPKDSVIVAIIDTGLDSIDLVAAPNYRTSFYNRLLRNASGLVAFDCSDTTNTVTDRFPTDENGHGTHVAGIIAKTLNAYPTSNVKFMIIKALNKNGNGTLLGLQQAVQFAVLNRAKVVNMSLSFVADKAVMNLGTPLDELIFKAGRDSNVLFVMAGGNDGLNVDSAASPYGYYPASFVHKNIISVAALDSNCLNRLAGFSNFGTTSVDISAPGRLIRSTELRPTPSTMPFDSYRSGTSMAAPHVAATAALAGNFKYGNAGFQYLPVLNAIKRGSKMAPSYPNLVWQSRLNTCGALQIITSTREATKLGDLQNLKVYPNPISNQSLTVEWAQQNASNATITLYNMTGQAVEQQKMSGDAGTNRFDWNIQTTLQAGAYIVKIVTDGQIATQQIIKF